MPTDASSAQTVVESSPVDRPSVDTSLLETQWAGRIVAFAFVLLTAALLWVSAATAMIG